MSLLSVSPGASSVDFAFAPVCLTEKGPTLCGRPPSFKGVMSWPKVSTCFQILKPTMNKWAQYPAQTEA